MKLEYFILVSGAETGPYSRFQVDDLFRQGVIDTHTPCRMASQHEFAPLGQVIVSIGKAIGDAESDTESDDGEEALPATPARRAAGVGIGLLLALIAYALSGVLAALATLGCAYAILRLKKLV